MNWTVILEAAGIPDSPGRSAAITLPPTEPPPVDLAPGQPCCVFFIGGLSRASTWRTGFRIQLLTSGGAVVGDQHLGRAGTWVSCTMPRCRVHPGATPPAD